MKSQRIQLVLGIAVAAMALYFTFRGVSFREVFETIKAFQYPFLLFAFVLFVLVFIIRAYRWRQLLMSVKPIPVGRLYSPLMIGFMGNLLPLRAGEFIRALLLGKREETGFSPAFATIVVERLFDLIAVLAIFAGLLVFNPGVFVPHGGGSSETIERAVRMFGALSLAVCLGVAGFAFLLIHQQERAIRLLRSLTSFLPAPYRQRIVEAVHSFTLGLGVLRNPRGIAVVVLLTALLWAALIFSNYPFYFCYQIQSELPLASLVTLLVLTAAAVMIPTPGFVGPWQFAVTFVLSDLYGIERSIAVSFSLVSWFLQMVLLFLAGFIFLVRDNVSLLETSRTARGAAAQVPRGPAE